MKQAFNLGRDSRPHFRELAYAARMKRESFVSVLSMCDATFTIGSLSVLRIADINIHYLFFCTLIDSIMLYAFRFGSIISFCEFEYP